MYEILLILHVVIAIMLIALILLQHGKGAQTGASFGGGASQTVFGSQGSGGFLSRTTGSLAALFFLLNLFLAYYINKTTYQGVSHLPATQRTVQEQSGAQPKSDQVPSSTASPQGKDIPEDAP